MRDIRTIWRRTRTSSGTGLVSLAAAIDAKHWTEKPAGYPSADVYQLLEYCTALGLSEGRVVYAKGAEEPAVHEIRNAGVRVVALALDLEQAPADLLAQVAAIARTLT